MPHSPAHRRHLLQSTITLLTGSAHCRVSTMCSAPSNPSTPVRAPTLCHSGQLLSNARSKVCDLDDSPIDPLSSPTRRSITATAFASASESPSLRRKRSSANASLTARPSMLSLREQCNSSGAGAGGSNRSVPALTSTPPVKRTSGLTADAQLEELMETLQIGLRSARPTSSSSDGANESAALGHAAATEGWMPDIRDVILVHIDELTGLSPQLGHALFQPNLLVTRRGDVVSIVEHAHWSLLRATVEETRVVYQSAAKQQDDGDPSSTFDVSRAGVTPAQQTRSKFYIQARTNMADEDEAAKPSELMVLTVAGVGSNGALDPNSSSESHSIDAAKFAALPNQLRKLLRQTDKLLRASDAAHADGDGAADVVAHTAVMWRREQLCNGIVDLVRDGTDIDV